MWVRSQIAGQCTSPYGSAVPCEWWHLAPLEHYRFRTTTLLPFHEGKERKGFMRTVWVLARISNVILYSVQSDQVHTAPCCKMGRGVFCDAVTQRWRCVIAQCGKESSHVRMRWPPLFLLRQPGNTAAIQSKSLLCISPGWVPSSPWITAPGSQSELTLQKGLCVVTSVEVACYAPPHCRRSASTAVTACNKSVFVKQTYFLIPEMDLRHGRGFYVLPERDTSHSFCFLFHFLKL